MCTDLGTRGLLCDSLAALDAIEALTRRRRGFAEVGWGVYLF
jgi:hypothetical protein